MTSEVLQQIGLNMSEVKVYLTLLKIGSSKTGPLLDKAMVSSSKIYGILNRLVDKGLVSVIIKSNTKFYQASSPEALSDYLKKKKSKLEAQEAHIKKLIPKLKTMQKLGENKQEAQLYLGWKGVMSAFNFVLDHIQKGDNYLAFAQTELEETSKEVKQFFNQFQRKRNEKKLRVKLLADKSQHSVFNSKPYTEFSNFQVRFLRNSPPGIIIFDDYIMFSTFANNPAAVIVHSRQISDSYRVYFHAEWNSAIKI